MPDIIPKLTRDRNADADLLDEFAKAALIGQLSHTGWNVTADAARWAYDCAEAMMKERARRREAKGE